MFWNLFTESDPTSISDEAYEAAENSRRKFYEELSERTRIEAMQLEQRRKKNHDCRKYASFLESTDASDLSLTEQDLIIKDIISELTRDEFARWALSDEDSKRFDAAMLEAATIWRDRQASKLRENIAKLSEVK